MSNDRVIAVPDPNPADALAYCHQLRDAIVPRVAEFYGGGKAAILGRCVVADDIWNVSATLMFQMLHIDPSKRDRSLGLDLAALATAAYKAK